MIFSDLLEIFKDMQAYVHTTTDPNTAIYGILPYKDSEDFRIESNVLYVIKKDYISDSFQITPPRKQNSPTNFLIIGKHDTFPKNLDFIPANIIFIESDDVQKDDVFTRVMKQISADAQLHETMRILTSALFDNLGVQHIIDVAHDIIKNPIFMLRYADKTLNYSCDDNDLNSSKRLKMIINDIETNRQSLKGQLYDKYLFQSKIIDELSNSSLQYKRFHNDYLGCEQIICLIRVRRLDVGYLTIIESSKKISEIDESAIWRLSELIGQELQKKTLYSRNRNELKAQFVNHLLTAKNISEEYVYEVTKISHITTLGTKFYVAVVEASSMNFDYDSKSFDIIAEQLQPILNSSFYLIREAELVILFNLHDKENIHELIDDFLARYTSKSDYIVGISNRFAKLVDTRFYYEQAKKANHMSHQYENWSVCYFSDIMPIEALHVINRSENLLNYCMPEVINLLEYDKNANSDLVTTLWVYLENFGNTAKSAAQLYIHKNTLLYRINKIKDILNNELDTGEDVYKVMMSLRILRILRMYVLPKELDNVPPKKYYEIVNHPDDYSFIR